jgi:phosphatidylglycerol:prolipoprotein diacylglycerol transferase
MVPLVASIGWPVLDRFRLGDSFAISPHGLFIAIGFLIGAMLLTRLAPSRGISEEHIQTIILWCLIGAIIGSRLFYVIAHFSQFMIPGRSLWASVADMFAIWRGGISLLGGIAGAVIVNVPRLHRYHYRFFQVADPAAVALALGITIGRIGDLIIGDHLGKPTSWLLAWQYKGGTLAPPFSCRDEVCSAQLQAGHVETITRASATLVKGGLTGTGSLTELAKGVGVHQTALYDMLLAGILFLILWTMNKKHRREGVLTLTFGLFYGCCRLLEDSLRIDKRFGPFTGSQWTALTVAVISASILLWWAFHPKEDDGSPPDGAYVGDGAASDGEPEPDAAAPA